MRTPYGRDRAAPWAHRSGDHDVTRHSLALRLLLCGLLLLAGPLSAQDTAATSTLPAPAPDTATATASAPAAQTPADAPAEADTGPLNIVVEGLDAPLRDNVLAFLDINRYAGKSAPEEVRLRWLHGNAEREIRQALEPFGYFEPVIEPSLERTPTGWEARYRIQPGRPLPLETVDIQVLGEGGQDPAFQKLLTQLPLARGQTLNQPQYEQFKQTLESLATERGYFAAHFTEHSIRVDLQSYSAAIHLHYDTGPRYRFGDVRFKQDFLSSKLLMRYPQFKPGDPYNSNDLLKLQGDLNASAYFSQVAVTAPPDEKTQTTPIDVELAPNKKRKYSAGLGYGTDTGVRAKLRVEQRWINRQGHRYDAELQYSTIKSLIGFKYIIPGADPTTDSYALAVGYIDQNYQDQDYQTYTLGGSWQRQDGLWLKNFSLNFQNETYSIGGAPSTTSVLLIPGMNWTWIDADDRLYTLYGLMFGFELRGASTALLSDTNFLQGMLHLKWVRALSENSRLLMRGDLGATAMFDDFSTLPTSLRTFTGGDTSVRGYGYNTIGPTDADGNVIGGKNLVVGSIEYEHRVWGDWSVAAFVDSGDAFDGAQPDLKTGVGVGLRWRSPVGPVRLDFASGLDRPPGDAFRFSFSIGPDL
jgi:translocation and assembly module TamA